MRVLNSPIETQPSIESCKVPLIFSKEEQEDNQKVLIRHMINNYSFIRVDPFGNDFLHVWVCDRLVGGTESREE